MRFGLVLTLLVCGACSRALDLPLAGVDASMSPTGPTTVLGDLAVPNGDLAVFDVHDVVCEQSATFQASAEDPVSSPNLVGVNVSPLTPTYECFHIEAPTLPSPQLVAVLAGENGDLTRLSVTLLTHEGVVLAVAEDITLALEQPTTVVLIQWNPTSLGTVDVYLRVAPTDDQPHSVQLNATLTSSTL